MKLIFNKLPGNLLPLLLFFYATTTSAQNVGVDVATPLQKLDVAGGMRIGNTTTGLAGSIRWTGTAFEGHNGSVWAPLGGTNTAWNLTGNSGTVAGTNFIGTTDAQDLVLKRFNDEGIRLAAGGALWASGNTTTGVTPASGAGTRMMWIPAKNAFRAGIVTGTQWDNANIGRSSVAFGEDNIASGTSSFVIGELNTASGSGAFASGWQSVASGPYSAALGGIQNTASGLASMAINISTASGQYAFSANQQNIASGKSSSVFGWANTAPSYAEVVVGTCATNYTPASTTVFNAADRVFNVGNGTSSGVRSDAFTILKNGNVGVGTATPSQKLDVAGKIRMQTGATAGYVPVSDANGTMTWTDPTALTITETDPQVSSTTTNYVPKWNGTTLVDGVMFDNGTNIGLGTTTPSYDLDINKNETQVNQRIYSSDGNGIGHLLTGANGGGEINVIANSSGAAFLGIPIDMSGFTTNYTPMVFATGTGGTATEKMRLSTSGNLGVGTTTPQEPIHIRNNEAVIRLDDADDNSTVKLLAPASGYTGGVGTTTNHDFPIFANDIDRITIKADGKVGIGTALPTEILDVNGKIRMRTGAATGFVPVSDASGTMTWTNPTSLFLNQLADADNDTKIQVEESADEDKIRFDMAGTEYLVMTSGRLNVVNTGGSTFLGSGAGLADDLSNNFNTFAGYFSGRANTTGENNVAYGAGSLEKNIGGSANTAIGRLATHNSTSGSANTAVGLQALYSNTNGSANTAIGSYSGNFNTAGSGNVFIGYGAGYNETGSNKLYIDNSTTSAPLIYGDFSSNIININGNLGIGTNLPSQLLDVNGAGLFRNGNTSAAFTNNQLLFGYSATANYQHAVKSRHNSGGTTGNTIDFYVWDYATQSGSPAAVGSLQVMTLAGDNGGSVGIGTTSPAQKLDVNGKIQMRTGATTGYVPVSDANGTMTWTNPTSLTITETDPQVSSTTTNYIPKWNGTTLVDGVLFDNGTNVGIGNTTPTYDLDIYKNETLVNQRIYANDGLGIGHLATGANGGGEINLIANSSASAFLGIPVGSSGLATNYTDLVLATGTGGTATEKMRLTTGGNLALGTTIASYFLSLGGDANRTIGMERTTGTDGFDLTIQAGGAKAGTSDNDGGDLILSGGIATGNGSIVPKSNIIFKTTTQLGSSSSADQNPSEKMKLTANGNLGIGNSAPVQKLSVTGGICVDEGGSNSGTETNALIFGGGSAGEGIGSKRTATGNQYGLDFYTGSSNRMAITNGGNVGIGTTNPTQAKLVVNGSQNNTLSYGYLNSAGSTNTNSGTNPYSIYASARIAATEFNAYSDSRIKNIIGISNSEQDLNTLMSIEITDYSFIDRVEKGNGTSKKVIAQQVEKVYPQAVSTITDAVPDIYHQAEIKAGRVIIPNTLRPGEKVKLVLHDRSELAEVLTSDAEGFTVNLTDEGNVFVFGREVSDFRTVDYEAISMLNVSATQELAKRIAALEVENAALKAELKAEKSTNQEKLERIEVQLGIGVSAENK